MIDGLKPYPAMKNSGVPWLGEVPEHWEVRRLRNLVDLRVSNVDKHSKDGEEPVRLCNYVDVYRNDYIRHGMRFMGATATTDEKYRFRLFAGDVLITKDSEAWNDIGIPALVLEAADDLVSGYHLALLRPFEQRIAGAFLFRALQGTGVQYQFQVAANGVTRYGLSNCSIKSVWLPAPLLPEQFAIVRFLDYADCRIRRLIRAKKKMIKLLEKQKQAIIHRAVTRGLDSNVRLKPSGVEWLGDVPEHWEVQAVRRIARVQGGKALAANAPGSQKPYLRVANVLDGRIDASQTNTMPFTGAEFERYRLKENDLLLNEGQSLELVGRTARYDGEPPNCAFQNSLIRVQAYKHADSEYLEFLFRHAQHNEIFAIVATQTTNIAHLGVSRLANLAFALPPLPEQRNIVRHINDATPGIHAAIDRANREIELLNDYRTCLIAEVVTGKLDVREAAADLPDERKGDFVADEMDELIEDDEVLEEMTGDLDAEEADA